MKRWIRWTMAAASVPVIAYGTYVLVTWVRYGTPRGPAAAQRDEFMDQFMPVYDVREHHSATVTASADATLAAARRMNLLSVPLARTLVRAREVILGATPDTRLRPRGLIVEMRSIGWGVLADVPGREIVMGAVTRPWEANVVFRPIPPGDFRAFAEPGYVKIVWTLRADAIDAGHATFSTETRAYPTDPVARAKFRRYWSFLSPGIILIRLAAIRALNLKIGQLAAS